MAKDTADRQFEATVRITLRASVWVTASSAEAAADLIETGYWDGDNRDCGAEMVDWKLTSKVTGPLPPSPLPPLPQEDRR